MGKIKNKGGNMNKKILFFAATLLFFIGVSGEFKNDHTQADSPYVEFVALGDSITHGTGDHSKKGYIGWFKDRYKAETDYQLLLKNYGVPKYRTTNVLEQLDQRHVQRYMQKADYLILYIGTNDFRKSMSYDFETINYEKAKDGKDQYSKNLDKILSKIRKTQSDLPIFILGLYDPYTNFNNHQQLGSLIADWNITIQRVANSYDHIHYIPTINLLNSKPKEKLFSDDLHPNIKGHQLIADRLLEAVLNVENESNKRLGFSSENE
jgi:lysophospholipase L1-like esterase